jgi:hypothetical protein
MAPAPRAEAWDAQHSFETEGYRLPARSSILRTAMTDTRIVTRVHRPLHEHRQRNGATERPCARCGQSFVSRRTNALYCSSPCRQAAYRERRKKAVA